MEADVNEAKLDEQETGPETAPSPKTQSRARMLLLLVAVALISSAGGSVMSWVLITKTTKAGAAAAVPVDPEKEKAEGLAQAMERGGVLPLDPFVVNLADADAARYLRIKVILMVEDRGRMKELTE